MRIPESLVIRSGDTGQQIEMRLYGANGEVMDLENKIVKFRLEDRNGIVAVDNAAASILQDDSDPDLIGMVRFVWGTSGSGLSTGIYVYKFIVSDADGSNAASYPNDSAFPGVRGGLAQVVG